MANGKFDKFIYFGNIADPKTRKKLATTVFEQLQKPQKTKIDIDNSVIENFSTVIDEILDNSTMKELCNENPELAENITYEILDFVKNTKKKIDKIENPFVVETDLYSTFIQTKKETFDQNWNLVCPFVDNTYGKDQIDTEFYAKEFQRCFLIKDKKIKYKKTLNFESVKEHFTDKWSGLLYKKKTDWELSIIEEQRKKFCEELYRRIEDLKKLQDVLSPFTNELGRLWDMSKEK
jgi:hypothetical protein